MADVTKRVLTIFETKGLSRQQKRLMALGVVAQGVHRRIGGVARSLASPLLAAGGAFGVGALTKSLVDAGRAAEDSTLQITGLIQKTTEFSGRGMMAFDRARSTAYQMRMEFMRLAKDSPATFTSIQYNAEQVVALASKAGMTLRQIAELSRDIAVADMGNAITGTAARDVRDLLQGNYRSQQIQTQALRERGKEIAALAKSGQMKAATALIQKALAPDPKLLQAYGQSITGLTSTAQDNLTKLRERAAKPLMEYAKDSLKRINAYLSSGDAERLAETVGRTLVRGLRYAEDLVVGIARNWDRIWGTVKIMAGAYGLARLVSMMGSLVGFSAAYAANMARANAAGTGGVGLGLLGAAGPAGLAAAAGIAIGTGINASMTPAQQEFAGALKARLESGGWLSGGAAARLALVDIARSRAQGGGTSGNMLDRFMSRAMGSLLDQSLGGGVAADTVDVKAGGGGVRIRAERVDLGDLTRVMSRAVRAQAGDFFDRPAIGLGAGVLM